jgi:hypothetical protein
LFFGYATADGVQVQPRILRSLNRAAHALAEEGWDGDTTFFHVKNHSPA